MSEQPTEHMLMEVSEDCERLTLDDGSQWGVEPGGTPTVSTWLPTSTIIVSLADSASAWPYELTNAGEDVSVRAMRTG